jgi:hypothetical protein
MLRILEAMPFEWKNLGEIIELLDSQKIPKSSWVFDIPTNWESLCLAFSRHNKIPLIYKFDLYEILDFLVERGDLQRRMGDRKLVQEALAEVFELIEKDYGENVPSEVSDLKSDFMKGEDEVTLTIEDVENPDNKIILNFYEWKRVATGGRRRRIHLSSLIFQPSHNR